MTLSIVEVRRRIAALPLTERCHDGCKGWEVFESNSERGIGPDRLVICRCDECFAHLPADQIIYDDDAEQLPEAQVALSWRNLAGLP